MRNVTNFVLFQAAWFAAVEGAARGSMWLGPAAVMVFVGVHLVMTAQRGREAAFLVAAGLIGTLLDSALAALGATHYPTSSGAWPYAVVPPWITSLWIAFAALPRYSLAWLAPRPALAALLGAVGGPLSYLGGAKMGAVAVSDSPALTLGALAVEYAIATPILLRLAPGIERDPAPVREA